MFYDIESKLNQLDLTKSTYSNQSNQPRTCIILDTNCHFRN